MHQFLKFILFYFVVALYLFRTLFSSIIRSLRLYIQHQVYVIQVVWLLASKQHSTNPFTLQTCNNKIRDVYFTLHFLHCVLGPSTVHCYIY